MVGAGVVSTLLTSGDLRGLSMLRPTRLHRGILNICLHRDSPVRGNKKRNKNRGKKERAVDRIKKKRTKKAGDMSRHGGKKNEDRSRTLEKTHTKGEDMCGG